MAKRNIPSYHRNCTPSRLQLNRSDLCIVLWRATHSGSLLGQIPATSQLINFEMVPRRPSAPVTRDEVAHHLDIYNRIPTSFLSFATWDRLMSRVDRWKKLGVTGIMLHAILTCHLFQSVEVYRTTELVEFYGLEQKPYHAEEYLLHGGVNVDAFLVQVSGDGNEVLVNLPRENQESCSRILCPMPFGILGGARPNDAVAELALQIYSTRGPCDELILRCLLNSITGGSLFAVSDFCRLL